MTEIISFQTFRRGAGTSSLVASTAALLAARGKRVGVLDANLQSPSAHILFGLDVASIRFTLNDYLKGECSIEQAVYDVGSRLGMHGGGQVYLVPGSSEPLKIMRILREGYEVTALTEGCTKFSQVCSLDCLVIDAAAGISDLTLACMAIADSLILLLRLDQQSYQGTAVLFEIARNIGVPKLLFVINDVPSMFNLGEVVSQATKTYSATPDFVLPHANEMLTLASTGIFALKYPDHPNTRMLKELAGRLAGK